MTHSGGKPHTNMGDQGQRFEVSFFDPDEWVRKVFGWSDTAKGARSLLGSIDRHPSWEFPLTRDRLQPIEAKSPRPEIVCICGSTRFIEAMAVFAWKFEKRGILAIGCHLLPAGYGGKPHHQAEAEGVADILDELHRRKIEMCDRVFVINMTQYIGDQTRKEIAYAESLGKPVEYMEPQEKR